MSCKCFHVLIYTVASVAFAKQGNYTHALNLSTAAMCFSLQVSMLRACALNTALELRSELWWEDATYFTCLYCCMSLCVCLCTNKSLMRTCCKLISNQVTKQVLWISIIRNCVTFIKADHPTPSTLFTRSHASVCASCPTTAHPTWHR